MAKTAAQRRIAAAPAGAFRKLTKAELTKLGLLTKSARYIETGKRVTRTTTTISRRAFVKKSEGASFEELSRQRSEGERPYRSKKSQAQAEKQRETRFQKGGQNSKRAQAETRRVERQAQKLDTVSPPSSVIRADGSTVQPYRVSRYMRDAFSDLRRRKLAGEFLADGDWHIMADMARATNDKRLPRLLSSATPEMD